MKISLVLLGLIFCCQTLTYSQSKKKVYVNALEVISQNDSIIRHHTISEKSVLFDVCPKLSQSLGIIMCNDKIMESHYGFTDTIPDYLGYCYFFKRKLKNINDYRFKKIPACIRTKQTDSSNWLVFSRYNQKYKVLKARLFLNIEEKNKLVNVPKRASNVIIEYTFLFNEEGIIEDFLIGAGFP